MAVDSPALENSPAGRAAFLLSATRTRYRPLIQSENRFHNAFERPR